MKKCHILFIFFLFSFAKSENRRVEQVLPREESWHHWEGRGQRKEVEE
jgi:hypothetical protein